LENYKLKKIVSYTFFFTSILFIILYFMLSFHARLAGDDYFYLWLKNSFGAWNGMMYQYQHWSGRWAAHFIGCALLNFEKYNLLVPSVCVFSFIMLFIVLYANIRLFFEKLLLKIENAYLIPASIILIAGLFFSSFNTGETWFWFIIIITYLWSIIGFLFILYSVFRTHQRTNDYPTMIIASIFIGGASESFALIFLTFLSSILIYRIAVLKKKFNEGVNLKLLVTLIFLAISFSFSAFAAGTVVRHSMLPHTPAFEKIFIIIKSYSKYFIRYLPKKLFILILFSMPWLFIGSTYKGFTDKSQLIKFLKKITAVFLIALFLMYIPTAIVMSETGPDRALSVVSFLTTFYFASVFFIVGNYFFIGTYALKNLLVAYLVIAGIYLSFTIYDQFYIIRKFSNAYEERMQIIRDASKNNFSGILELKKMPESGMLYWDELSTDTSYFTNQHLRDGLKLSYNLKLAGPQ
jgi:hypothetical protein